MPENESASVPNRSERRRSFAASYNGAGERNRTADPFITSEVLYQLSYTSSEIEVLGGADVVSVARAENGATPQNRTGDTVIFSHVLYQLS